MISFDQKKEEFRTFYFENYDLLKSVGQILQNLINALIVDKIAIESVIFRIKRYDESIEKFQKKYRAKLESEGKDYEIRDHIIDLIGVRIVCLYQDDIISIQKIMESCFSPLKIEVKEDGPYKGLHMDLILKDNRGQLQEYLNVAKFKFELQIRTIVQDAWSVLDHKIRYKKNIPQNIQNRVVKLSELFNAADGMFLDIKKDLEAFKEVTEAGIDKKDTKELDVFSFLYIGLSRFGFNFDENDADEFLHEVKLCDPSIEIQEFINAIAKTKSKIESYSKQVDLFPNSYTFIRHCLYLYNKKKFKNMLFESQRNLFEDWLKS